MSRSKWTKILQERRLLEREPIPDVLVTWPNSSLDKLVAEITAPANSVYAGDVFTVEITILNYPDAPPRAVMLTPIFHPNIDTQGAICIASLRSQFWKFVHLREILLEIVSALEAPNPDDELHVQAAGLMRTNFPEFEAIARDQVMKNCAARGG
jgi:ubiquitin-conjugating enzyme E2 D/E